MASSTPEAVPQPLTGAPSFLMLGAWEVGGATFEIASRRRLDTRQVIPWFEHDGELHVGVLQRRRASRALRGAPLVGLEPVGIDFAGVDETGDILEYGRSVFNARTRVSMDEQRLKIPLPSYARSIGYLTEWVLPLFVAVQPPPSSEIDVEWDGGRHRLLFRPVETLLRELEAGAHVHSEELPLLLRALAGPGAGARTSSAEDSPGARELIEREPSRVWDARRLATFVERPLDSETAAAFRRRVPPSGADLRFLRAHRVHLDGQWWEVVTPGSGQSLVVLPFVRLGRVVLAPSGPNPDLRPGAPGAPAALQSAHPPAPRERHGLLPHRERGSCAGVPLADPGAGGSTAGRGARAAGDGAVAPEARARWARRPP